MKKKYLCSMVRRFALLLLFSALNFSFAQSGPFAVTFPAVTGGNPGNLTVCSGQSKLTVQIDVTTAATGTAQVTVQLAPGVQYVPNSVAVTSTNASLSLAYSGGTPNAPQFTLSPNTFSPGGRIIFTIDRTADCSARSHSLSGGDFQDTVTAGIGTAVTAKTSSPYTVLFPILTFAQPANQNNTSLGQTYTRTFSVSNGSAGHAGTVYLQLANPAANITNSITLTGGTGSAGTPVVLTADASGVYTIPAANLSGGQLNNGESLIFTENFTVRQCNQVTTYRIGWGCNANPATWCNTITGTGSVTMAVGSPAFSTTTAQRLNFTNSCTEYLTRFFFTNSGTGNTYAGAMYDVIMRWGGGAGSALTVSGADRSYLNFLGATIGSQSNISVTNGSVANQIAFVDLNNKFTTDPDGPNIGLDDLDGDGFYDDLAPNKTITIDVRTKVNCSRYDFNQERGTVYDTSADMQFHTMCDKATYATSVKGSYGAGHRNYFSAVGRNGYVPANVYGSVPFRARFSVSYYYWLNELDTDNTRYVYEVTLPPGFSVSGNATGNAVWTNGEFPLSPTTVPVTTTLVSGTTFIQNGQILTIISPTKTMGYFEIDLVYNCPTPPASVLNVSLPYSVKRYDNIVSGCTTSCNPNIFNGELIIGKVHCSAPCTAAGIKNVKVERANNSLGWTDATLNTRQTKNNISAYDLSRALYLDDIEVYATGVYGQPKEKNPDGSWGNNIAVNGFYLYFGIVKMNGTDDKLTPKSIDVTVYRNGSVIIPLQNYSAASFATNTGTSSTKQVSRWNLTGLMSQLQPGDEIVTKANYTVSSNNLPLNHEQFGERLYFYNTRTDNGAEVYCSDVIPEMYLATTSWVNGANSSNFSACTVGSVANGTHYIAQRFNTNGMVYYKELRPGMLATKFEFTIPASYAFDRVEYDLFNRAGQSKLIYNNGNSVFTVTNNADGSKTYVLNLPQRALDITVTNDYSALLDVFVRPTCLVSGTQINYNGKITYVPNYYAHHGKTQAEIDALKVVSSVDRALVYNMATKPAISITNLSGNIQASKITESFNVRIASTGNSTAPNIWMAIPTVNGVNITKIVDISSGNEVPAIAYANGKWYKIDAAGLAPSASREFRIEFTYTTCTQTNIQVLAGWDCASYPNSPSESLCTPLSVNMSFVPQNGTIQIFTQKQPSGAVTLCTPLEYEFRVNSAAAGNTKDNAMVLYIPPGMTVTPGTMLVEYPAGSGNWQQLSVAPTYNSATRRWTLDLTKHPAYPSQGLPGTLNAGAIPLNRQIGVKFTANTDCSFVSGSYVWASTTANQTCGQPAIGSGIRAATSGVRILGADSGYFINTAVNPVANTFEECISPMVLRIKNTVVLTTASATPSTGTVHISIPEGYDINPTAVTYVSSSPSTYTPAYQNTVTVSGVRWAVYSIPAGMVTGAYMEYDVTFVPNSYMQSGNFNVDIKTVDNIAGLACPTNNPPVCSSVETITGEAEFTFSLNCFCYKPANYAAGTTVPSKHGITSLGRAGTADGNWPMARQSAWTVLEANTKGFVINRIDNIPMDAPNVPGQVPASVIASPVSGMMVYDIKNECLKIYDGSRWACFKTPACPD